MIGRIIHFLPSICVLLSIFALTCLYLKIIGRLKKDLQNIEWVRRNKLKAVALVGFPIIYLWAPLLEELIFRAPIVVLFGSISNYAWIGISISSALFAAIHCIGIGEDIYFIAGLEEIEDIDSALRVEDLEKKPLAISRNEIKKRRLIKVASTFILGMLAGYFGVKYQSLYVCVGIHIIWNLVMPIILQVLLVLIYLFIERLIRKRSI